MNLYVIRHGQTEENRQHRYLGSFDPQLNATGRAQADEAATGLPARIDLIISSPLLRARETARIIGARLDINVAIAAHFRERNVGVFEGLTQAEARHRYPELWARNITRQWDAAPPGGETISEVVTRVRTGLLQLTLACPDREVLLVAHGFVAKVIRALVQSSFADFFTWQLANGQLLSLNFDSGVLNLDARAGTNALPGISPTRTST